MTVAELLQQSRAAHDAYRMALPRLDPRSKQVIPGDSEAAAAHLARAFDLRWQAEQADQGETSSAWADDAGKYPHYDLLHFYDRELTPAVKALLTDPPKDEPTHG